jgi:basic membrane protein A
MGLAVVALAATACGGGTALKAKSSTTSQASSTSSSAAAAPSGKSGFKACMVTDTGGIDDRSFNASAWQGLQEAHAANPKVNITYLQSTSQSDYVPNITTFINQHCNLIVTVGFLMAPATQQAAKAHPSQKFAIVDNEYSPPIKNVRALLYDTADDAFLGGYLAAGMTRTGTVATYGGEDFSTVTIYMDGFWDGVQYYDAKHHAHVKVLGWNEKTQHGIFVGSFTDQSKAEDITNAFIQQGADIIFPVAGDDGLGTVAAAKAAPPGKVHVLWVDTNGCVSDPQGCPYFYASVTKGIAASVKQVALATYAGHFQGGNYIGTFKNDGIALIYGKDLSSKIPASLKAQIAQVKQGIESGKIPVPSPSTPKV